MKADRVIALTLYLLTSGGIVTNASDGSLKGREAAALAAAEGELVRRHLDPGSYRIVLRDNEGIIIAVCVDRETPPGARGIPMRNPTLEVEIDPKDLHVIRSYFAR
jgi:hypothetical protein